MEFEEPIKQNQTTTEQPKPRQADWVDTTDSLEAVEAMKGWKNFLFIVALIALILVQIIFWLANTGIIPTQTAQTSVAAGQPESSISTEAAKTEPNLLTAEKHPRLKNILSSFNKIDLGKFRVFLAVVNTILILAAIFYSIVLFSSVLISVAGRLGGINHISRAFFLSLAVVILLLPWQKFLTGFAIGAVFNWQELSDSCNAARSGDMLDIFVFYTRFCTLWLLALILLISAQIRSSRWAKAILRRLEVI